MGPQLASAPVPRNLCHSHNSSQLTLSRLAFGTNPHALGSFGTSTQDPH